jgi:formylglycine-generating enzyme required for sulfatase activity
METMRDPVQEEKGKTPNRVFRGGSWSNYADNLVVSARTYYSPGARGSSLGFRPVRNAKEKR